jgi:hypothetical protein
MAERSNVPPWKGGRGAILSGVRIPLSPLKQNGSAFAGLFLFSIGESAAFGGFEKVLPYFRE